MIQFEDECVGCPPEMGCIRGACPYANVPYVYCDVCGEEILPDSPRYNLDNEYHVCEKCEPDEDEGELCDTCANHYMDDCGWCCKKEGDEGCEFWHEDVRTCAFYKEDKDYD